MAEGFLICLLNFCMVTCASFTALLIIIKVTDDVKDALSSRPLENFHKIKLVLPIFDVSTEGVQILSAVIDLKNICPICRDQSSEVSVRCEKCLTWHCEDCLQFNNGLCSTYGCPSAPGFID